MRVHINYLPLKLSRKINGNSLNIHINCWKISFIIMGGHFIPTHHAEVNRSLAQGTSVKLSKLHVGRFNYNNITPVFMILPF